MGDGNVQPLLDWLEPPPVDESQTDADRDLFAAMGISRMGPRA